MISKVTVREKTSSGSRVTAAMGVRVLKSSGFSLEPPLYGSTGGVCLPRGAVWVVPVMTN